jgi:hypothetical protein
VNDEHWVLKHRSSGKLASRPNQAHLAIQLEALRLMDCGMGGGIVTLTLPTSAIEEAKLTGIKNTYRVERVKPRNGKAGGVQPWRNTRDAVTSSGLLLELAPIFARHVSRHPGPHQASVKAFTRWLTSSLTNNGSDAYQVANRLVPSQLSGLCNRTERWWADTITQGRKTQS